MEKSSKKQWENEYIHLRGIDLDFKQEVPESVLLFHKIAESIAARKGTVLDIGCGAGVPVTRHLDRFYDVTGIDISSSMIAFTRRNVPDGNFFEADVASIEFDEESFDI